MRRPWIFGLTLIGALSTSGLSARAQNGSDLGATLLFNDPFLAYYSYFIPQQIYQASRPRAEDTVGQYSAARQYSAMTERAGLYDPLGAMELEADPLRAFGSRGVRSRMPRTSPTGLINTNLMGRGASGYHNRTNNYFPTLRNGQGGNGGLRPVSTSPRSGNLGGGSRRGMGMGGMGMGMPGMGMPG